MKWNIVADSSIDLFNLESDYEKIKFSTVPFTISVGDIEYVDDENLDIDEMILSMKNCKEASRTACPSVGAWYNQFEKDGNVIALTITSNLSGSYNSACIAKNMILEKYPDKKIEIIDSLSVGPEMILILRRICSMIKKNYHFDDVVKDAKKYMKFTNVSFVLSSFDNLIKNGRMNKLTGFVANKLSLLGIGIASEKGTIEMKGIARGKKKAIETVISDIKQRGKHIKDIVISHCKNIEFANILKEEIEKVWGDIAITVIPTRGLCSYYAEVGGLIIGF